MTRILQRSVVKVFKIHFNVSLTLALALGRWHGKCIGLKNKAAIAALPDPWACQKCSKESETGQQTSTGKRVACPKVEKTKKEKKKGVISGYNLYTKFQVPSCIDFFINPLVHRF